MRAHWLGFSSCLAQPGAGKHERSLSAISHNSMLSVHTNLTIYKPCPGVAGVVIAIELYS